MTPDMILFLVIALVTLAAGFMVVTTPNIVHAALWLILNLFAVAVLYVMLNAGFFAMVQVVVYIGAIAILFIFAIMLTRQAMRDSGPRFNTDWPMAAILGVALLAALVWILSRWHSFMTLPPTLASDTDILRQLGQALVSPNAFFIPFEIASVLLVAAMIGAIYVAWGKSGGKK
ncbi:MAG: NADH-quinone oxidoreductase subunit J [Anaerolineales bacterium]|jgi:NADH-quinone oxidoreductase subunit J|nr:NADH-quinone oxidoreductase subunit J [Anaerolineales bacterium]